MVILIFNIVGYQFIFNFLEKNATNKLDTKIDLGNINEADLIEIKIPLKIPYYSDKDYEVAYGQTEINGVFYNFVKRKISGNTLYLMCLPNIEKTNISNAKKDFSNPDFAKNSSSKNKQNKSLEKLWKTVFIDKMNSYSILQNAVSFSKRFNTHQDKLMHLHYLSTLEQPPESI